MKTNVTTSEALAMTFLNEYDLKHLQNEIAMAEKINEFYPCEITHNVTGEPNDAKYNHSEITLQTEPFKIKIRYWSQYKKFLIHGDYSQLKNIENPTVQEAMSNFTEPQKIGVLSTKKIQNWVDYITKIYQLLEVENKQNENETEAFLKSLEGRDVKWDSSKKSGSILKNGIEFTFRIEPTHISKNITLHYKNSNDLKTFDKLSDNKQTDLPRY